MSAGPDRAVVLAAGRGTRMMADASLARGLDPAQRAMARSGLKMLIPFRGRPFIVWVIDELAKAGFQQVCIVTGPGTASVRDALARNGPSVTFAEQATPRGTADALLAVEGWAGDQAFAVVNGDNWYPADALARLRTVAAPATIAFEPAGRVASYAVLTAAASGCLDQLVEKPDPAALARLGHGALVSMTCWSFTTAVFAACRAIGPSTRGELELPDAVRHMVATGACVRVVAHAGPVLDLGAASDVATVAARLPA